MPNVIKMRIDYAPDGLSATVRVLTEGAVNDVAAYALAMANNDLAEVVATRLMHDVAADGVKMTEKEATLFFEIPPGKRYRR